MVVTRKVEVPLKPAAVLDWIEQLEVFPCAEISPALVKLGAVISERYRISYWDGAILAAAESLGARMVYTEDLSDGQSYGPVRAVNPFLEGMRPGGFHDAGAPFSRD